MRKYVESKPTRIMMATVPHVISGLGLRKFQADGFLLTRVYRGYKQHRQNVTYYNKGPVLKCMILSRNRPANYVTRPKIYFTIAVTLP